MSDMTAPQTSVTIAGEEHPYSLNMASYDAIRDNGYSGHIKEGEDDSEPEEPGFTRAFWDAENGDLDAQRLIVWVGLLPKFQDKVTGVVDYDSAPPQTITSLMTLAELVAAMSIGLVIYVATLPPGTLKAAEEAAEAEAAKEAAAEAAGRPTPPRKRKR